MRKPAMLFVLGTCAVLSACQGQFSRLLEKDEPVSPATAERGRALFIAHNCYGCHGGRAGGGMGPDLRAMAEKMSRFEFEKKIMNGVPEKGMPAWKEKGMKQDEAESIAAYLKTLGKPNEPTFALDWKSRLNGQASK